MHVVDGSAVGELLEQWHANALEQWDATKLGQSKAWDAGKSAAAAMPLWKEWTAEAGAMRMSQAVGSAAVQLLE